MTTPRTTTTNVFMKLLMRPVSALLAVYFVGFMSNSSVAQTSRAWKMHDMSRPRPPVVVVPDQEHPVLRLNGDTKGNPRHCPPGRFRPE